MCSALSVKDHQSLTVDKKLVHLEPFIIHSMKDISTAYLIAYKNPSCWNAHLVFDLLFREERMYFFCIVELPWELVHPYFYEGISIIESQRKKCILSNLAILVQKETESY